MSGAKSQIFNLARAQTVTGAGQVFDTVLPDSRTYQAVATSTSGNVSATVLIEGSLDGANFVTIATLTCSSTSLLSVASGSTINLPWKYTRSNITAISGTGAAVSVYMGI